MKIVQSILNRMRMRAHSRNVASEQELVLYRHLRCSENKLHDARVLHARMLESQRKAVAGYVRITQAGDDLDQQDSARQMEELQKEIASAESDVNRLEIEYQHAQMNVRTYFYLETSPGSSSEGGVMAAQ